MLHIVFGFLGVLLMSIAAGLDWATLDSDSDPVRFSFTEACDDLNCVDYGYSHSATYAISVVILAIAWIYAVIFRFVRKEISGCGVCGYVALQLLGLSGVAGSVGWWSIGFFVYDAVSDNEDAVTLESGVILASVGMVFSFLTMFMLCICGRYNAKEFEERANKMDEIQGGEVQPQDLA